MKILLALISLSLPAAEVVARPGQSPIINFRIAFRAGAANDPAGKAGLATFTATMLSDGGTKAKTRQQILDEMYPMAARLGAQVDKEMIVFEGTTHAENLEPFYVNLRDALLAPGWREDDLKRIRDAQTNALKLSLRGNNDEELGKEVLYEQLYAGHPYGHVNLGKLSAVGAITMADLQGFYKAHFTQANLIIGVAGNYPKGFVERMRKDFAVLPKGAPAAVKLPALKPMTESRVTIVDKKTRAVAYSIGFPITVTRNHPDYPALLVASDWFGKHRSSGGNLYQRMREIRGLNYGDYSYIEYFPNGMYQFEPDPNMPRRSQIFQIWVRPVEPPTAHFALRLALFELDRLVDRGMTESDFETTRDFVSRSVSLLMKTKSAELGYAIDSKVYGIPEYTKYIQDALAKLTYAQVQAAIKKHLRKDRLHIVAITDNGEAFKKMLLADEPSPMKYNSPKPGDILEEDKIVAAKKLGLKADQITVIPEERVFQ
jgi:zinc protease